MTAVAAIYAAAFAYFLTIQLATNRLACIDVFFHMRYAVLLREHGPLRALPWMNASIFRDRWVDQHFLFHFLLVPFTFFPKLLLGAKAAAATFAAAAITAVYWFLRRRGVSRASLWTLFLVSASAPFLYRMNMVRGMSVALVLFLVYLDALLEGKRIRAFVVAFLFVWTYQLFLLLVPVSLAVLAADLAEPERKDLKTPAAGLLGMLAGMVFNPDFPRNLVFLYQHAVVKVLNRAQLSVGGEWGPFDTWFLVKSHATLFLLLTVVLGVLLVVPGRVRRDTRAVAALAALFFFMTLRSRRFVEYWPAFAVAFSGLTLRDLSPFEKWMTGRRAVLSTIVLTLAVGALAFRNHRIAIQDVDSNLDPARYQAGADWLSQHSAPKEVVFTTDWDDFAELFFYNQHNYYLVGLDPTFMYLADPTRYTEWAQIADGQVGEAAPLIRRDFNSRFVLTDPGHTGFIDRADADSSFRKVYGDKECSIYQVVSGGISDSIRVEAETRFPLRHSGGSPARVQDLKEEYGIDCSDGRLLLYRATGPGDFLEFEIRVPREGRYRLSAGLLQAADYGLVQASVDGETIGGPFDGFARHIQPPERRLLGELDLDTGPHRVRFTAVGKSDPSAGYLIGLDYLDFVRVGASP